MSVYTPEDKFRALMEDLGKPTLRGIRRCPKCGTQNGTRGISCKNKNCDVIFKEREKKKGHSADSVKIITGSTVKVCSVRLRDRGPDYRGFVQLPLVQDLDGNPAENVDPAVLESAGRCYVETCVRSRSSQTPCNHIKAAVSCSEEAQPLTLKNSVLNSLDVSNEIKQDIWLLATETSGPLVQRVTKNIMVVKCKPNSKHPLGFLHFAFFETVRNRNIPDHKFHCSCRLFKMRWGATKDDSASQKRCVHYYACICAFASDDQLSEEFAFYLKQDNFPRACPSPVDMMVTITSAMSEEAECFPAESVIIREVDDEVAVESMSKLTAIGIKQESIISENVEVVVDEDTLLSFQQSKRMKPDDLLIAETLVEQSSSSLLSTLQEAKVITTVLAPTTQTPVAKKPPSAKTTPAKSSHTPKKIVDESSIDLSFQQWLASITERINQTMHYQFDGSPEPLVFHSPQKFFDCLQQRISMGSKKKRLPNFTTGFIRKDALPLGTFTKYTWYITSIFHVKQIFDTATMPLEITRSFVENRDGTYDLYESPKLCGDELGKTPIRPFELKTYLKVGVTSPEQKDPTPFVIEWIPDILPKCRIGELRIKFEYGHQRNGTIEHRSCTSAQSNELQIHTIQLQPAM